MDPKRCHFGECVHFGFVQKFVQLLVLENIVHVVLASCNGLSEVG